MESLLQIIIANITDLFRAIANDEKKELSQVYATMRRLSKFSKNTVDYCLMPLKAKSVFTTNSVYEETHYVEDYNILPNGMLVGEFRRTYISGAYDEGIYLDGDIWIVNECNSKGGRSMWVRNKFLDFSDLFVRFTCGGVEISIYKSGKIDLCYDMDDYWIIETEKAHGYRITIYNCNVHTSYFSKQSCIYDISDRKNNTKTIMLLSEMNDTNSESRLYEIAEELAEEFDWTDGDIEIVREEPWIEKSSEDD